MTWTESGLERASSILDQATFDAWLAKAGKASALVQNSSAGQSLASQQLFTHCRQMASYWEPVAVSCLTDRKQLGAVTSDSIQSLHKMTDWRTELYSVNLDFRRYSRGLQGNLRLERIDGKRCVADAC